MGHGENATLKHFLLLPHCFEKTFPSGLGVVHGSVMTRNFEVWVLRHTGSSGVFIGVSLGETIQSPNLVLVKPWKYMI